MVMHGEASHPAGIYARKCYYCHNQGGLFEQQNSAESCQPNMATGTLFIGD
jgi:hypothetical protein